MEAVDLIIESFQSLVDQPFDSPKDDDPLLPVYPSFQLDTIAELLTQSVTQLSGGKALVEIQQPVVIVGDLHGSLADLISIFQLFGTPQNKKFLFLGDFVDRGQHSIGVTCLILAYLCKYPDNVFVLRGNHEFSHINRAYGFYDEIMSAYSCEELWCKFQEVFSWFPLAAIISQSVFCVHGGISPLLKDIQTLRDLPMPINNYLSNTMISDLIWSDPVDMVQGFQLNHRGSGQIFGPDVVEEFLKKNNLKLLIRAHQCNFAGFRAFANFMGITVFSSSNYCQTFHNKCGVVSIKERTVSFFSLEPETEYGTMPRAVMSLPADGDVGLKTMLRTMSTANFKASYNENLAPEVNDKGKEEDEEDVSDGSGEEEDTNEDDKQAKFILPPYQIFQPPSSPTFPRSKSVAASLDGL